MAQQFQPEQDPQEDIWQQAGFSEQQAYLIKQLVGRAAEDREILDARRETRQGKNIKGHSLVPGRQEDSRSPFRRGIL